jgi:hypothetical protein
MITTAQEMRARIADGTFSGVILWQGASQLDGNPVVAIATGFASDASRNGKTGTMIQTWIIRSNIDPMTASRIGGDFSVCGDCKHKPSESGLCYVIIWQAPRSVYAAFQRGRYARPGIDYDARILPELFRDSAFRAGSYGDPVAIPYRVWRAATRFAASITGYSHQWRQRRFWHFRRLCMASVDSLEEMNAAHAMGWRTFRVRLPSEPLAPSEKVCPASKEAGRRTTCDRCTACGGLSARDKPAGRAIIAHGAGAARAAAAAA